MGLLLCGKLEVEVRASFHQAQCIQELGPEGTLEVDQRAMHLLEVQLSVEEISGQRCSWSFVVQFDPEAVG